MKWLCQAINSAERGLLHGADGWFMEHGLTEKGSGYEVSVLQRKLSTYRWAVNNKSDWGQKRERWQEKVLMAGGECELGQVREGSVLSALFPTPSSVTDSG